MFQVLGYATPSRSIIPGRVGRSGAERSKHLILQDPQEGRVKEFVLALDQGTTSSRAIVFDLRGTPVSSAQQEFPQLFPQPGWVEHDPEAIWSSQLTTARQAIARAHIDPGRIAAIGIANQRETTLLWDRKTGQPLANAIVWQCRRTAPMCDRLRAEGFDQVIRERTGLVADAYFSGTKLAWLLENVPDARGRAERGELAFGTVDTFLLWRLTAGQQHVTDPSNASRTMLYNIHTLTWDETILDHLGIPVSLLPSVRPSSEVYAATEPSLFGAAIPIAAIAGDQQAALFGQACFAPGMAKNTYGTGCFMLLNTGGRGNRLAPWAPDHRRMADAANRRVPGGHLLPGGKRLHRRRRGAVAARRAADPLVQLRS